MIPLLLFALALALRLYGLGDFEIGNDEVTDLGLQPWGDIWFGPETYYNPPPQRLLNRLVYGLSFDPFWIRLLPALFGSLSVPAIYFAGRRLGSVRMATVAALLVCLSPLHLAVSQLQRAYALLALSSALLVWSLSAALAEEEAELRGRQWTALALTMVMAPWSHLMGFLLSALTGLVVLARQLQRKASILGPLLLGGAVFAGTTPLLIWTWAGTSRRFAEAAPNAPALDLFWLARGISDGLTAAPLLLLIGSLVFARRGAPRWFAASATLMVLVTLAATRLLGEHTSVLARYVAGAIPPFGLAVALLLGAESRPVRLGSTVLVSATALLMALNVSWYFARNDSAFVDREDILRPIAEEIARTQEDGPVLVVVEPQSLKATVAYYLLDEKPERVFCEASKACPDYGCQQCGRYLVAAVSKSEGLRSWLDGQRSARPVHYVRVAGAYEGDPSRQFYFDAWTKRGAGCTRAVETPRAQYYRCSP